VPCAQLRRTIRASVPQGAPGIELHITARRDLTALGRMDRPEALVEEGVRGQLIAMQACVVQWSRHEPSSALCEATFGASPTLSNSRAEKLPW
jgi:hypothetical protein